jgi:puromycin-sensitive aminopeptidase
MTKKENPFLLPRCIEPVHYDIDLQADLEKFTFSGSETIKILIQQPTSTVTLHALDLRVKKAEIRSPLGSAPITAKRKSRSRKMETLTFDFGQTLQPGEAELRLEFKGELNDKMHGFYRTSYTVNGQKKWGAATQFEATDARRAFPCWDEPERKATFTAKLTVPEHLTALSNMPARQETKTGNGWKSIEFEKTPRMSSYLLAFVIADLEFVEGKDRHGVPIRVWTSPGKREHGRFALEEACHTVPYFADWFGIPYAFPKLDMVALPDFAAGAMENWGLITYRETALLIDPENSSAAARQRVADVVDHELAHQWFGNYTTMKWWTDLWLNEGFASYMGPKATDHNIPEWDTWTQYVAQRYMAALHEDALRNTHPVEVPVRNPNEIREVFDAISYSKGSVVNRMLEHYLGEDNFRKGLNLYLTRHAFANATTDDLWKAIEEASGKPVQDMMASYTRQPGFPVLIVKDPRKKKPQHLDVEQKRFLVDGGRDAKRMLWQIPIGILTSGSTQPVFEYMEGRRHKLPLPAGDHGWIKLNPGQSGFYRVAYPKGMWLKLAGAVAAGQMPTVDRLGILDDAFALARAAYLATSTALSVLKAYQSEKDYSVWTTIAGIFGTLDNLLSGDPDRSPFHEGARQFFLTIASEKGWEKMPADGHLDVLLRSLALRNLGGYGDTAAIEEARQRFAMFRRQEKLDPDLRQTVYSLVAENGGGKEWEELLGVYNSTDLHEERVRVLHAAGSCREAAVLKNLLQFSLSENVRYQDTPIVLGSVASHSVGRPLAWEFVKEHWQTFVDRYHGGGIGLLSRMIGIPGGFTSKEQLQDAENFYQTHHVPGTERAVKKTLEILRSNIAWLERDGNEIREYFAGGKAPTAGAIVAAGS